MSRPAESPRDSRNPAPQNVHGATILVVEDDPRVVELLQIALGAHGFRVVTASNGDDAWSVLLDEQPDLMILDVRLPRRSGLELCESIRNEPAMAHLPIIMVSALAETEARLAGLARGADDYLPKPFSPKELVARVRRQLARAYETTAIVTKNRELNGEVERSRADLRRINQELRREFWIKEAFLGLADELTRARRLSEVASAYLFSCASHLGVSSGALLVPTAESPAFAPVHTRGLASAALLAVRVAADGELARIVAGLARPVRRAELERFPELASELGPLVAAGVAVVVPLVTRGRAVGFALLPEKVDANDFTQAELEMAHSLAQVTATALDNARMFDRAEDACRRALTALAKTQLEKETLTVAEAYAAFLEGAAPGKPVPDAVRRFFSDARGPRTDDRPVAQALDELLRIGRDAGLDPGDERGIDAA
jgi:DNA-binding response OmpR family regulator